MADHGNRRRWQLVLTTSPLQGHMTAMLQLGTTLHSKGFSIIIAHSKMNPPDPSNQPDFVFLPLADNLSGHDLFVQALNNDCIIPGIPGSVAFDLGLPSIIVHSCRAAFSPVYNIIPQLYQESRFPIQDPMLNETVPELHPLRYKDLPFIDFPIQKTLESITMLTPKKYMSTFIWNTVDLLEQAALTQVLQHYQVPIFAIGPPQKTIASMIQLLDRVCQLRLCC